MAVVEGTNAGFVTTAPTSDPTGQQLSIDTLARACKFTSPSSYNVITSMGWWCDTASEAANYQLGIYSHDAVNNRPDTLLATSGDIAKGTTAGWKTGSVIFALTPSTTYWLAVQLDDTATTTNIDATADAGYKLDRKTGQTSLPTTWGTDDSNANIPALYAVYTPGTILTTSGITNPSITTRGYKGGNATIRPPALGGSFSAGDTELTTAEYTAASAIDASYVTAQTTENYTGVRFEFLIPAEWTNITGIYFGIRGYGNDGYNDGYGWTLYIKDDNIALAWDSIADTSGLTEETLTGIKTTNIDYWIDTNNRICLLAMNKGYDGNGSGGLMVVNYGYAIITGTCTATSNIKTEDGLAKGNIKTMNGIPIAQVKTVDGLA